MPKSVFLIFDWLPSDIADDHRRHHRGRCSGPGQENRVSRIRHPVFRGELGQPYGGFLKALQSKILKGETPLTARPGSVIKDTDLDQTRVEAEGKIGRHISDRELASYLMYPQGFADYAADLRTYGDVRQVPTKVYFYGMNPIEEIAIDMERGKSLALRPRPWASRGTTARA